MNHSLPKLLSIKNLKSSSIIKTCQESPVPIFITQNENANSNDEHKSVRRNGCEDTFCSTNK